MMLLENKVALVTGVAQKQMAINTTENDFDGCHQVNLKGVWLTIQGCCLYCAKLNFGLKNSSLSFLVCFVKLGRKKV